MMVFALFHLSLDELAIGFFLAMALLIFGFLTLMVLLRRHAPQRDDDLAGGRNAAVGATPRLPRGHSSSVPSAGPPCTRTRRKVYALSASYAE